MTAVDQHGELHRTWAPVVGDGVERSANGTPGVEHVVDEHDGGTVDVAGQVTDRAGTDGTQPDVVAVEAGVDGTDRHGVFDAGDLGTEEFGEPDAALLDPDERHAVETTIAFDDLVGHPGDGAAHVVGSEHQLGARLPLRAAEVVSSHVSPPCEPHGTRFTVSTEGSSNYCRRHA